MMTKRKSKIAPDSALGQTLQALLDRLSVPQATRRACENGLTTDELSRLSPDCTAMQLTRAYAKSRKVSFERALIDLAEAAELISAPRASALRRQLGEPVQHPASARPLGLHWDGKTGQLYLDGKKLRKRQIRRNPTNIQRILDAFQDAGWPNCIDNPLARELTQNEVHLLVNRLNSRESAIRFSANESGWTICVEVRKAKVKRKSS